MKSRTKIPFELKVRKTKTNGEGEVIGKWILRKAFENLLPTEIIRRKKDKIERKTLYSCFIFKNAR